MPGVVRVLPDIAAVDREFDYLVPPRWASTALPGAMVRVPFHGRRVAGWITAVDVEPPEGVALRNLARVSGIGPPPDVASLCEWAAWRWAGSRAKFYRAASPDSMVSAAGRPGRGVPLAAPHHPLALEALTRARTVLRLPPTADVLSVVAAASTAGDTLVVCPSPVTAGRLTARIRRAGGEVALLPRDWHLAAAGGRVVIGGRAASFAPMPHLAAVVVLDEHDEALQQEGAPTWHAREVCLERARRARVPALMTSPCPTLESQRRAVLVAPARAEERAGWPIVEVVDRRDDDLGRTGLYSEVLVRRLHDAVDGGVGARGPAVCVLNRQGRASLLACHRCGTLTSCERCDGPLRELTAGELTCRRCGTTRPTVCQACGGTVLRKLRVGVSRAREELAALLGCEVDEVTASNAGGRGRDPDEGMRPHTAPVVVGTVAVLQRLDSASVVAFLEIDQELLAPRYRASEEAMTLFARAAGLVGDRAGGGRIVVQTRLPDHEVLAAAVQADPAKLSVADATRRRELALPPYTTTALIGGPGGAEFVGGLSLPAEVEVTQRNDEEWWLVAGDRKALLDAVAATPRPSGRLRLQIDPLRT